MSLTPMLGHQQTRARLSAAIEADRLPQVLLVTGPAGVGKQRLGLWLAERLICEARGAEPCGICGGCLKVRGLAHPDVHWLVPVPRPKAADSDKQVEEVAGLLEEAMAERRTSGAWGRADGMSSHGIASARLLQRRARLTAAEGGWRVFIIGRAERLVPQESSPEAANALLKLLEEPPAKSVFVLTTTAPGLMLTTIRSRSVPVRLGRLKDDEVRQWVAQQDSPVTKAQIEAARGSIGRVLGTGDDGTGKAIAAAQSVLDAAEGGPGVRARLAVKQGVSQARGDFTAMLDALAELLADRAKSAAAAPGGLVRVKSALDAIDRVHATRELAQGNINPQLALAVLADELAELAA